jgi:hypothetical protein
LLRLLWLLWLLLWLLWLLLWLLWLLLWLLWLLFSLELKAIPNIVVAVYIIAIIVWPVGRLCKGRGPALGLAGFQ